MQPQSASNRDSGEKTGMIDATARAILGLLAKEWEHKGPPGILDISEIVAALPLAPSDVLAGLKDLFERGLVDMNSLKTSAFLTPEGYATVSAEDSGDGPQTESNPRI